MTNILFTLFCLFYEVKYIHICRLETCITQFIYVFIQVLKSNFEDIVLIPKILQHFFRLKTKHFTLQIFPFARSVTWKAGEGRGNV